MKNEPKSLRSILGLTISMIGFGVLWIIPIYFLLQFLGITSSGVEAFGYFGYLIFLFVPFSLGFSLLFVGLRLTQIK